MNSIVDVRTEFRTNPLGIDVVQPRFSWRLSSKTPGASQSAYRVLVASAPELLTPGNADMWDSQRVETDQSIQIEYDGKGLLSRQHVTWRVIVWDDAGQEFTSEPAWFEMGLLQPSDWQAQWIGGNLVGGAHTTIPAPYVRRTFTLPLKVASARLYITSLGNYECSINGHVVHDDVFAPGWTDYSQRIQYMVYDVGDALIHGENVIGAVLGDGWAVGHVGMGERRNYADRPQLLAQLDVTLADGSRIVLCSDDAWVYQYGPLLENDMLMGEAYDARLELTGWDTPAYDDGEWQPVKCFEHPSAKLVATNGPVVRRMSELTPATDPQVFGDLVSSRVVFDMGQNMVGRARFQGSAPEDTTVTLRFAEVLDKDGKIYTDNLRTARATDYYTFRGDGLEVWEPKFTFHGFRYVELSGYPGEIKPDTITGIVLYSDIEQTGAFSTSARLINQLQSNIQWGQKGNFVDVPTDCPQRDERLGWTGDIQMFARTAAYNMNIAGFLTKWMRDVADAQGATGEIPAVVPNALPMLPDGGPAWSDAAIICPWTLYQCYGDLRILNENYEVMQRFIGFLLETSDDLIRCSPEYDGWPGFGDWLSINADTPRDLIGTAFLAYDADLMSRIASVLGRREDARSYLRLFEDVRKAFQSRYLKGSDARPSQHMSEQRTQMERADAISRGNLAPVENGPVASEVFNTELFTPAQTAYVLALHFDLLPETLREQATAELVADIERHDWHLTTGFVGAPYLPHVLSDNGRTDVAYTLLNQTSWPSWLYAVTQGATTIWERWDGWTEENGFQSIEMNSFNHYAYGSIGAWLYSVVAGIDIDAEQPGYKHSILRPRPGGELTQASGTLQTPYGELSSSWTLEGDMFTWDVVIPPNSWATAILPDGASSQIQLDGNHFEGIEHKLQPGDHRLTAKMAA